jgi:hypothetical protein
MKDKNKPFPFGNDGPPGKRTEAEKRAIKPDEIKGYLPTISMECTAYLRREDVPLLSIFVLQLLVREQKIEASRRRDTDNLRVPSSVRRNLRISNKSYQACLKRLEEVGAITLNRDKAWTAAIKIDTETKVRDTLVDSYGQRRERRW